MIIEERYTKNQKKLIELIKESALKEDLGNKIMNYSLKKIRSTKNINNKEYEERFNRLDRIIKITNKKGFCDSTFILVYNVLDKWGLELIKDFALRYYTKKLYMVAKMGCIEMIRKNKDLTMNKVLKDLKIIIRLEKESINELKDDLCIKNIDFLLLLIDNIERKTTSSLSG